MARKQIYHNTRLAETYVVGPSQAIEQEYGYASELPYTLLVLAEGGEYISSDGFTSLQYALKRASKRSRDTREINFNTKRSEYAETDGFYDPIQDWRTTL